MNKLKSEIKQLERAAELLRTPAERLIGNRQLAQLQRQRQEQLKIIKTAMGTSHLVYALLLIAAFLWWLAFNGFLFGWVSAWVAATITTLALSGVVFVGLLFVAIAIVYGTEEMLVWFVWRKHRDSLAAVLARRQEELGRQPEGGESVKPVAVQLKIFTKGVGKDVLH
jgi:hypothetical protein